eukprot:GHUV01033081.1.p1 GENE.GHUV01033081.1~~GHUV01033081.1.p1  ORF type:complete len:137 (+),score=25.30 GHUV01033081.1:410-820(+)
MHIRVANSCHCSCRPHVTRMLSSMNVSRHSRSCTPQQAALVAAVNTANALSDIIDQFQGVLLDQFGVLHDGKQPYPHAIAAVQRLHEAGKQIIVLSNSSRRSGGTIKKLAKLGFKAEWFAGEQWVDFTSPAVRSQQ